ncbi:MAG: hypothetical protein ACI9KI_001471, partial [Patiriisocius sp.]
MVIVFFKDSNSSVYDKGSLIFTSEILKTQHYRSLYLKVV